MSYTIGALTFTASEDIEAYRVLALVSSSTTDPMEVRYATNQDDELLGISKTAAKSGSLVTVEPFDRDGTYQITASGSIAKGNRVYVSIEGGGRINDESQVAFVGRALERGTVGRRITVAFIHKESSVVDASNVNIDDAGDYYTSGNVEDALQEVGGWHEDLTASEVAIVDAGGHYTSDNVEGALAEVGESFDELTASQVAIVDAGGYYTGGDVENALQQLGRGLEFTEEQEWFQFEHLRTTAGGGLPAGLADMGGIIAEDTGPLSYKMDSGLYGNYYLQARAGTDGGGYGIRAAMPLRIREKIATEYAHLIYADIYYECPYTAGSLDMVVRLIANGTANRKYLSNYNSHSIDSESSPVYREIATINSGDITFEPDYFTLFMRFDVTGDIDANMKIYGVRLRYYSKIIG